MSLGPAGQAQSGFADLANAAGAGRLAVGLQGLDGVDDHQCRPEFVEPFQNCVDICFRQQHDALASDAHAVGAHLYLNRGFLSRDV